MPEKPVSNKKTPRKKSIKLGRPQLMLVPQGQARHEALEETIRRHYHVRSPDEIDEEEASFTHSHMEMYSIEGFNENGVELRDFTNDEIVSPVIFPLEILEFLRPGDLFLFTIGYAERRWYVIWMSGLYQ